MDVDGDNPAYNSSELRDAHGHWTVGGAVTHIIHSLAGARDDDARQAMMNGHAIDTRQIHSTVGTDGEDHYSDQRGLLHQRIINHFLAMGTPVPDAAKPEAIFTAGGPASGKSPLAGAATKKDGTPDAERNLPVPRGHVPINPDLIKPMLPEYDRLIKSGRGDIAANAVHEESSHIAKQLTTAALKARAPIVVDGVGDSGKGKFAGKVRAASRAGHHVTVRYAHAPTEQALVREVKRSEETNRKVDHKLLRNAHKAVSARYNGEIKKMKGVRVEVYNTSNGTRGRPKLIAVRDPHRGKGVHVIDRKAYEEHVRKSQTRTTRERMPVG